MFAFPSVLGLEIERRGIQSGFLTGYPALFLLPVAETSLVVWARKEVISVWNRKIITYLESCFRQKQTKTKDAFYSKSVNFLFIWRPCYPLCVHICDYVISGPDNAYQAGWVTAMCTAFSSSPSSWAFQRLCTSRKKGTGFPDAALLLTNPT